MKVVHVNGTQIYLNQGSNNGMEKGMRFIVYRKGETIKDPDTGVLLGAEQTQVGIVELETVNERMSIAKFIEPKSENQEIKAGDLCKKVEKQGTAKKNEPSQVAHPVSVESVFQ